MWSIHVDDVLVSRVATFINEEKLKELRKLKKFSFRVSHNRSTYVKFTSQ